MLNSKLHSLIQKELNQITSNHNYYGSENQIQNEIYISSKSKVEMLYNETIEEYYKRLLK
tara:strand:- start:410 stop:589 length:180 start_codon:yes stop_codon:yes gene_type:complete